MAPRVLVAKRFQFTLPRGERHDHRCRGGAGRDVSIHAPAWGATLDELDGVALGGVSIHAPAWGATRFSLEPRVKPLVSIHAPAWGATKHSRLDTIKSNPFQFTLPRGERLDEGYLVPVYLEVSIHAPAWGATASRNGFSKSFVVSIHAPAWGATYSHCYRLDWRLVSIHAPAWGATLNSDRHIPPTPFQFTLPRGERRCVFGL